MKFKILSLLLTIPSLATAAVEHFDVSNAHSSQSQSYAGGGKPIAHIMARSSGGPAPVYSNAVAEKRGSYGNNGGYVDPNVQNAAMQGVAVTQIATSGSMGSASSISSAYGVPATGGGYGQQAAGNGGGAAQGSQTYYYYHYPPPGSQYGGGGGGGGSGWGDMTAGGGDDDDLKGLTGLLGLLGLKGLKGLGVFALLKLLKPLLLLSLLFLPLLLLPLLLLLLFIPIPIITQPGRRSLVPSAIVEGVTEKVSMGLKVLNSSQCVERIACEISQKSKGTFVDNFISSILDKTEAYLPKIWLRGMRTYVDSGSLPESDGKCAKFSCKEFALFSATSSTTTTTTGTEEENKIKVDHHGLKEDAL